MLRSHVSCWPLLNTWLACAGAADDRGCYTNTEDIDCEVCKGDLHLWAVVSEHCPGRATCAEHPDALGAPLESLVLLYRCAAQPVQDPCLSRVCLWAPPVS